MTFDSIVKENSGNERPVYKKSETFGDNDNQQRFGDVEEVSAFGRELWQSESTGSVNAEWLKEVEAAIWSRVPPPSEEEWELRHSQAVARRRRRRIRRQRRRTFGGNE